MAWILRSCFLQVTVFTPSLFLFWESRFLFAAFVAGPFRSRIFQAHKLSLTTTKSFYPDRSLCMYSAKALISYFKARSRCLTRFWNVSHRSGKNGSSLYEAYIVEQREMWNRQVCFPPVRFPHVHRWLLVRFDAYDACVVSGCFSDICHGMPQSKLEHYNSDTPVLEKGEN
jgi:hypothetical protein